MLAHDKKLRKNNSAEKYEIPRGRKDMCLVMQSVGEHFCPKHFMNIDETLVETKG